MKWLRLLLGAGVPLLSGCSHHDGKQFTTYPGTEDLALIEGARGRYLAASTAWRHRWLKFPRAKGRIETLDLDNPTNRLQVAYQQPQRGSEKQSGFRPVGVHSVPSPDDEADSLLHIANGVGNVTTLKVSSGKMAFLRETPKSPLLEGINGITATHDGVLYASTFGASPFPKDLPKIGPPEHSDKPQKNTLVMFRPRSVGGDDTWRVVAHGFAGANGLALTPDEKHLLVCSYYGKSVRAFARDTQTGLLTGNPIVVRSRLDFYPDNLKALGEGQFAVAGQRSYVGAGIHLILPFLPVASGGGERFTWQLGSHGRQIADYTSILRKDHHAPSTVIPDGSTLYVGHIVRGGVGAYRVP